MRRIGWLYLVLANFGSGICPATTIVQQRAEYFEIQFSGVYDPDRLLFSPAFFARASVEPELATDLVAPGTTVEGRIGYRQSDAFEVFGAFDVPGAEFYMDLRIGGRELSFNTLGPNEDCCEGYLSWFDVDRGTFIGQQVFQLSTYAYNPSAFGDFDSLGNLTFDLNLFGVSGGLNNWGGAHIGEQAPLLDSATVLDAVLNVYAVERGATEFFNIGYTLNSVRIVPEPAVATLSLLSFALLFSVRTRRR